MKEAIQIWTGVFVAFIALGAPPGIAAPQVSPVAAAGQAVEKVIANPQSAAPARPASCSRYLFPFTRELRRATKSPALRVASAPVTLSLDLIFLPFELALGAIDHIPR